MGNPGQRCLHLQCVCVGGKMIPGLNKGVCTALMLYLVIRCRHCRRVLAVGNWKKLAHQRKAQRWIWPTDSCVVFSENLIFVPTFKKLRDLT